MIRLKTNLSSNMRCGIHYQFVIDTIHNKVKALISHRALFLEEEIA